MIRKLTVVAAAALAAVPATARAETGKAFDSGGELTSFFGMLTDRLDQTIQHIPKLGRYLLTLPNLFPLRETLLLVAIVVVGLGAEYLMRWWLQKRRESIFSKHSNLSPLRAFLQGAALDGLALLALWVAARLVAGQVGDPDSVAGKVAHQVLLGLVYWRGFNFVFRAWLHPNTPEGRMAPVDDATAKRLLVGMNVIVLVPVIARHILLFLGTTGAGSNVISTTVVLIVPVFAACLIYAVWHWRRDGEAWLAGMVGENDLFRPLKLAAAHEWWIAGVAFYVLTALAAIYAAIADRAAATHGLAAVESMLILLLLLETLVHRRSRHLPTDIPTAGEVVAACLRLAVRLVVIVVSVKAILIDALGTMSEEQWAPHENAMKIAAISAFVSYAFWRFIKYRMDKYIADNPLPTAGFGGNAGDTADDDQPASASRLRTIMPVLRVAAGVSILILSSLLVLSELGVNITPLIAGASVLGLAVSFGSQSLVRDIVSGVFFLAEDSFRVGEYIDGSKVKGTVEGFSIRSIRLRHQNGQLHIVPFGQITHITNFSRDWTTVKFNLSFALDTDVELLRKTVKKIGLDMMNEPQFQKEMLAPLKMQGIVDIKDASLIVRFKFTAKPANPSLIQRTAIRRMFDALPKLGIEFAKPPYANIGFGALDPAARAAAQ